jgi:hypothetical protein
MYCYTVTSKNAQIVIEDSADIVHYVVLTAKFVNLVDSSSDYHNAQRWGGSRGKDVTAFRLFWGTIFRGALQGLVGQLIETCRLPLACPEVGCRHEGCGVKSDKGTSRD